MELEQADAILRANGYDPVQVGRTGARIAELAFEVERQKQRAEMAEAALTAPKRKRAPGGGRPRTVGGVKVAVTLGREHLDYLTTIDANRSAAIRRVIEEHKRLSAEGKHE